ncbi:MAG: hypothetical protein PHV17_05430 [Candidatus Omnitrophica bacterium]|nr:hypothetical protein [Candidatus Omnitrophota bacterium]
MNFVFLLALIAFGVIFVLSFSRGYASLRYLYYFWIFCFCIGPRSIVFMDIKIFFLEGITWLLFFLLMFRFNFYFNAKKFLSKYTIVLFCAVIYGVVIALLNNARGSKIFFEIQPFLALIPTFYIVYVGFKYLKITMRSVITVLALGAFFLTMIGVPFYFFPSLNTLLPSSLTQGDSVLVANHEVNVELGSRVFKRGGGGFWGLLLVAGYLALILFPIFTKAVFRREHRLFLFCVSGLIVINIFVCGQRSVWSGLLLGIMFYSYCLGAKSVFKAAVILFLVSLVLPQEFYLRFSSLSNTSNWAKRDVRYLEAIGIIRKNPLLGAGWTAGGWTHNAILQIGANLGLIGLSIFLLWCWSIFKRGLKFYSKTKNVMVLALLSGGLAFMGPLNGESVICWSFLMIPFWFFSAVLYNYSIGNVVEEF